MSLENGSCNVTDIDLMKDEQIVFSSGGVLLTNRRVFVENRRAKRKKRLSEENPLWLESEISVTMPPTMKNGGKTSRKASGLKLLTFGLLLVVLQVVPYLLFEINIIQALGVIVESVYFLCSMLGVTIGSYFYVGSFVNLKPHTSVLFSIPNEGRSLVAIFSGWDSPEAEKLGREFRRIRRTLVT
jgi:hypothetical protein